MPANIRGEIKATSLQVLGPTSLPTQQRFKANLNTDPSKILTSGVHAGDAGERERRGVLDVSIWTPSKCSSYRIIDQLGRSETRSYIRRQQTAVAPEFRRQASVDATFCDT